MARHHTAAFSPDPEGPAPAGADWQHRVWLALGRSPRLAGQVALVVALALGALGALSQLHGTTVYTSKTVMLIDDPLRLATAGDDGVLLNLSSLRLKYSALIDTDAIAGPVAKKLGLPVATVLGDVSGQVPTESLLMDVSATTGSPALSARLATATAARVTSYVQGEDFDFGIPPADRFTFTVIDPASAPTAHSPSHAKAVTVGLALGLIGLLGAFGAVQLVRNRDLLS